MKPLKFIRHLLVLLLMAQGLSVEAQHYVPINGELDTLMVLPKLGGDSVYWVNESLTVVEGGTLRVEGGVKMYFGQSAYLRVDGGSLLLEGQRDDSISLLCYEFSHDWAGLQLKNIDENDTVRISYVEVVGALTALNASTSSHAQISHCSFNNYYAGKGVELIDCSNFLIDSCFFFQCVSGIELKSRTSDSEDNVFSHNIFDQGQINIELSNVGYGFKCNRNRIIGNCFQGASTAISFEATGGMSDKDATNYIEDNLISSELPEGGSGYSSYGIKAAMDTVVVRNNVFWSNDEAIRMIRVCYLVVEQNTFYDNKLTVTNLMSAGYLSFVGNTISEAEKRIVSFPSAKSQINGNNFLHFKKDAILFANVSTEDIDMRGNYWDVADTAEIDAVILDQHDSPSLGEIVYENYLSECDTTIPIAPPFRVKKQFVNNKWLISWDENLEQDVDHYVLFYGNFNYYKFANRIDGIVGNSYVLTPQQTENLAVVACDRAYDPDVYASPGQSAYAFATYYPYAGPDGSLCASQYGYALNKSNIPYQYSSFVWRSSGTGAFADSLSLQTFYYPSDADYEAGEVTLTLRVTSNGTTKTDALQLNLYKALGVYAGEDGFSGTNRPIVLDQAEAYNYDSLRWHSLGDGRFEDSLALHTLYYPGALDKEQGYVELMLEAWSFCGQSSDMVRFELFKDYILEGRTWSNGALRPHTQVIAAAMGDDNPFVSGFYRTLSDDDGFFRFDALLPDTYVLYAFPDTLDADVSGCYYLGDLQWNESNMIEVDGNVYDVDLSLPVLTQGFNIGEGRITGLFDMPDSPFKARDFYCQPWLREGTDADYCSDGLSNVGVLLLNAGKQRVLGFALTDEAGHFSFNHLPFGTYQVMADLPRYGRGMCEEITLSAEQPIVSGLHLFVNEEGRVRMRYEGDAPETKELSIYPNPVDTELLIGGLKADTDYQVTVMDVLGLMVVPTTSMHTNLLGEMPLTIGRLSSGVYFILVDDGVRPVMAKFVKR
ncbi:MAG: right-handed parallel beta-helix repeat-containing protein [bacterium]|nr:right-handed parallel beta-helix repeat-containing protein [bacterium]